jgi:FkbM family methyltransferase
MQEHEKLEAGLAAAERRLVDLKAAHEIVRCHVDYSQGGEQRVAVRIAEDSLEALAAGGGDPAEAPSFLDIGAHDGKTFSNSRALTMLGWRGLCVEAAPGPASLLVRNLADQPYPERVHALCAALVPEDKAACAMVRLHTCGDDMGATLSQEHRDKWHGNACMTRGVPCVYSPVPLYVPAIAWPDLIQLACAVGVPPTTVQVVSIDTEGNSVELLLAMPIGDMPNLRCVIVEKDNPDERARAVAWLVQRGFKIEMETPENLVAVREVKPQATLAAKGST